MCFKWYMNAKISLFYVEEMLILKKRKKAEFTFIDGQSVMVKDKYIIILNLVQYLFMYCTVYKD